MPAAEFLPVPRVPRRELQRWSLALFPVVTCLQFKLSSREYSLYSVEHTWPLTIVDFSLMPGTMQETSQLNLRTPSSCIALHRIVGLHELLYDQTKTG